MTPRTETPVNTRKLAEKYSFQFKKGYGQNFLIDERVIEKMVDACGPTPDDLVIEIGPGFGCLTERLARRAGKVCAVEIDGGLIPILTETLTDCGNVEIIRGDILKTDIGGMIAGSRMKNVKVAANLPFNIATAVISELLERRYPIETITVMVQKEAAERLSARPGSKNYGSLSLLVKYYSEPFLVANVPVNCFFPRPTVDSAVMRFTVLKKPPVDADGELLFKLIRAAFSHRRKTLVNCLLNDTDLGLSTGLSRENLEALFIKIGFPKQIRGEALGLAEFAALAAALSDAGVCA